MRRQFLIAAAVAAVLAPDPARAESFFVFPEVGLGYGWARVPDLSDTVAQLDLHLGSEFDAGGGPRTAVGWMFNVGYVTTGEDSRGEPHWWRVHLAPMLTLSNGYNWWTLFARVGVGPHFELSEFKSVGGRYTQAMGGGLQIDAAIGSKNAIELFTQALVSFDRRGPSYTLTGGLRLNVVAFLALMDLLGSSPSSSAPSKPRPPPKPGFHPAGPVRP